MFKHQSKAKDRRPLSTEAVMQKVDKIFLSFVNCCFAYLNWSVSWCIAQSSHIYSKVWLFIWPMSVLLSRNLLPVSSLDNTSNIVSYVLVVKGCKKKETIFNTQNKNQNLPSKSVFAFGVGPHLCRRYYTNFQMGNTLNHRTSCQTAGRARKGWGTKASNFPPPCCLPLLR